MLASEDEKGKRVKESDLLLLVNNVGVLERQKLVEIKLSPLVNLIVGVAKIAAGHQALGDKVVRVVGREADAAARVGERGGRGAGKKEAGHDGSGDGGDRRHRGAIASC